MWSVRSVWFVWLHKTNQMDQTDQACPRRAGHRSSAVPKWFFRSLLGFNMASTFTTHDPKLAQQLVLDELFDLSLYKALRSVTQPDVHHTLDELIKAEVLQSQAQRVEPRPADQTFRHDAGLRDLRLDRRPSRARSDRSPWRAEVSGLVTRVSRQASRRSVTRYLDGRVQA